MPVSHEHRLIFIHIPKTGGTSILEALRQRGVTFDLDGTGLWDLFLSQPHAEELVRDYRAVFRVGTLANASQQHLPARIVKHLLGAETWNAYHKVAFVRNPWDLLVSGYHYQTRTLDEESRRLNPDVFALLERSNSFEDVVKMYPVIRSDMTSFITEGSGELVVDQIGRFEHIERDFALLCDRIGVRADLPHLNDSRHEEYRSYYSDTSREIVARHFARDIERFGYSFE